MIGLARGQIVLVQLDPVVGSEANKTRPALIVANAGLLTAVGRHGRGVITVAPITSVAHTVRPFQVALPASESGLPSDSKVQIEQLCSVDLGRIIRALGALGTERMAEVDEALRFHLAL